MLRQEATDLAVRITQCFTGPPIDIWEEDLGTLDAGQAGTTLARLRREHEQRWLSIAAFMAMYRSLDTTDASTPVNTCHHCDNTGWVRAPDVVRNEGTDTEYHDTSVKPCDCDEGQQRRRTTVWQNRGAA